MMTTAADNPVTPAWYPTADYLQRSRLRKLMQQHQIDTVPAWRAWAAADIGRYWDTVVRDLDLTFAAPYTETVDLSRGAPWPQWFVDGSFSYVS
ncbi:MAG TPA: hypothetical protein PK691_12750, partial [Thermomicrobiales bacterium]|nr:hypothetical protein [Thermomicrobiales bacterium]